MGYGAHGRSLWRLRIGISFWHPARLELILTHRSVVTESMRLLVVTKVIGYFSHRQIGLRKCEGRILTGLCENRAMPFSRYLGKLLKTL